MVSGINMSVPGSVSRKVSFQRIPQMLIRLISRTCALQTLPEPYLFCSRVRYPAGTDYRHPGRLFPGRGVRGLQKCFGRWDVSK